jgi:Kef-type K+ transport system membrane component KefB
VKLPDAPLLLQLLVILVAARLCSLVLRKLGQPAVIGEMIAGLLLGPVVLGALWPQFHGALFAKHTLGVLEALGQVGLVLFMFVIGCELRAPEGTRTQLRASSYIAGLSVLLPAMLGLGIAPLLHAQLAPPGVAFWPFALFLALSLSVTAFPVLARILKDQRRTQSTIGQLSLTSASMGDVFAWTLLAVVVALINAGELWTRFFIMIGGVAGVAAVVFYVLRPCYAYLLKRHALTDASSAALLASLLIGALACAAATEWLGLHAAFGAFLFGTCLPRGHRVLDTQVERVQHVAIVAFLPVFFATTGLSTDAGAFSGAGALALGLILLVAISGKMLGAAVGARVAGYGWRDSFAVGSLMNTRGLMELIFIKVGLQSGVIGRELFTILLVMAIITTMMTSPLLMLYDARAAARKLDLAGSGRSA